MRPSPPKTATDEKIGRHFNGIVMTVLAIMAAVLLLAILLFYKAGPKVIPSTKRHRAPDTHSPQ